MFCNLEKWCDFHVQINSFQNSNTNLAHPNSRMGKVKVELKQPCLGLHAGYDQLLDLLATAIA